MTYLSVGTNYLYKELFIPIKNTPSPKPCGGLWLTKQNPNISYNSWIDYCLDKLYLLFRRGLYDRSNIPAVFIILKDDANIFNLDTPESLDYLLRTYSREDEWIDYEKLAKDYDGLNFDYNLISMIKDEKVKTKLKSFAVSSVCLFNPTAILSFQSAQVIIENPDINSSIPTFKILIDQEIHYLNEPNEEVNNLIYKISLFIHEHNVPLDSNGYEIIKKVFAKDMEKVTQIMQETVQNNEVLLIRKAFQSI